MVFDRLKLKLAGVTLVALAFTVPGGALPNNDPGPFWPLQVAHTGSSYQDALPGGATYTLISGRLPNGLSLSSSGRVSGTARETGEFEAVLQARESSGARYPVRVQLSVRRGDESDLRRVAPSFASEGNLSTTVDSFVVNITNTFDGQRVRTRVRVVRPRIAGPHPLLLFHRGRGFDEDSYTRFHQHIASHGIAVASVEDSYSFTGASFHAGETFYDIYRAELGMLSASGVVEAVGDYLLDRSDDPSDSYSNQFDADNVFFAGHSRGGGAAHASHQRSFNLRLKGLIYLMAFDLRYFEEVAPGRVQAPAYPVFDENPRTPSLIIAAENDGDLTYPIADQLIDRATGPATQVTLYGGVHNLISDSHRAEGDAKISRTAQRTQVADWMVCFIKRWAEGDEDLEWRLYGGAHQSSGQVGIASWRPAARTVLLEDAQDADSGSNRLGRNYVASMRRRELSIYPEVGSMRTVAIQHTLLTPTAEVSAFRMATSGPVDLSRHQRVVLRMAQTGRYGWEGYAVWLRLIDNSGGASWYRVWEPSAGGDLPTFNGLTPLDRFFEVHVDLADFGFSQTPADLSQMRALDMFLVERDSSAAESVVLDNIRFE